MRSSHNFIDLTGQRFGKLTVKERTENTKHGQAQWLCVCDCGNNTVVSSNNLKNEHVRSCGCLRYIGKNKRCEDGLFRRICIDCYRIDEFKYPCQLIRCRSCAEKYKYKNRRSFKLIIKKPEEIFNMIELYEQNKSLDEIGKKFNTTRRTICRILKENYPNYKPRGNKYGINKMHETIRKQCKTGEWQRKISAKAQGISLLEWNGFITKESEFFYKSKEWKAIRNIVYRRDNYRCQLCGNRGSKKINAHHIQKRSKFKELSLNANNLITLCVDCHFSLNGKETLYEPMFQNIVDLIYSNILHISPTYFSV